MILLFNSTAASTSSFILGLILIIFLLGIACILILRIHRKKLKNSITIEKLSPPILNKKIVLTERSDDIHTCVKDHPEIWGNGKNAYEAIGNLVNAHSEFFNINIERLK